MPGIFISKDPEELSIELQALVKSNIIEAQSLLDFSALPFECPPAHDILFLASIRAADFFFSQCNSTAQIACAGLETARKVAEKHQKEVHFIAQQSDQPKLEAERFNIWRHGRSVCFPSSQLSIGTYASLLPLNEKIILPVYQTQSKMCTISEKDIYVFSSPSNVQAFLASNHIPTGAKIVAWGSSTANALIERKIGVTKILNGQQQEDLLHWLSTIL
jgi:uroporphyrinogen-III synthase